MQDLLEKEEQDKKYNPAEGRYGSHDDLGVHPERKEAEVDKLNRPLDTQPINNESHDTKANKPVKDEQSALNEPDSVDNEHDSNWKNSATNNKQRSRFKLNRKRAAAGGMLTGLCVGGTVGFFVFMQGPLQFIQFAKVLERFHFGSSERFGNSRTAKIFRWATKKPRSPDLNMSLAGNKVAVHYEKKLRAAGIDMQYGNTGRLNALEIDPSTPAGKKFLAGIEAEYGVPLRPKQGDSTIHLSLAEDSTDVLSAGGRRSVSNSAVEAIEMNGISESLAKRVLKRRAGVSFHPLKNLARSVDEKTNLKFNEWKEKIKEDRAKSIKEGSKPPDVEPKARSDDPDHPPTDAEKQTAQSVDDSLDDVIGSAKESDVPIAEKASAIKGKLSKGVGAAAVIALLCGLDKIGEAAADLQDSNIIQPLIRTATTGVITPAGQIMSGEDVSMDELGALSESFFNKEDGTSWMSAESIQYNLGNPDTGIKVPDSAKPGKDRPAFFQVIHNIVSVPVLSQTCSAMSTTAGVVAMTAANFAVSVTGVGTLALQVGSEVVSQVLSNAFMEDIVRWIAGDVVDLAKVSGGQFGAIADLGAFLADNNSAMALGGRELTTSERVALINENQNAIRQENKHKKFYARMFDIKSPDSLVSKTIIQNNSVRNPQTTFANLIRSPFNVLNKLGTGLATLNPRVMAQTTPYDYGVPKIGFSIEERNNPDVENPYDNEEKIKNKLPELNKKYGEVCFGSTVDPSSGKLSYAIAPTYKKLEENKAVCGPENKDPDFLRYRMYLADTATMLTMTCYESIDESACQEIGLEGDSSSSATTAPTIVSGAQIVGNPDESSVDVACAPGTNDVGVQTGYEDGSPIQHRMCAIPNFPSSSSESTPGSQYYVQGANGSAIVNSRVSGAWLALVSDMIKAGLKPVANSSFRTMEHQQSIYAGKTDKKAVARPGYSPHQSAQAIDFNLGTGGVGSGSTTNCSQRQRADNNPVWVWLFNNADKYGFRQYSYEAWHWDSKQMQNRCGSSQP